MWASAECIPTVAEAAVTRRRHRTHDRSRGRSIPRANLFRIAACAALLASLIPAALARDEYVTAAPKRATLQSSQIAAVIAIVTRPWPEAPIFVDGFDGAP